MFCILIGTLITLLGPGAAVSLQSPPPRPKRPPDAQGKVTRVENWHDPENRFMVVQQQLDHPGGGNCLPVNSLIVMSIPASTTIVSRRVAKSPPDSSREVKPGERIDVGNTVSIWFDGALRLSSPPQATARYIEVGDVAIVRIPGPED